MRLYLIRHPQPAVAAGLCYGRTDLPLRQPWSATAAKTVLPPGCRVLSSPLLRCREFAHALNSNVTLDDDLRELDFGAWEMQPWDALPRAALDAWAADPLGYAGHGGECVQAMRERVVAALQRLDGRDCIWVTHAGVMKLVFAELLGLPPSEWLTLHFDYAAVSLIEIDAGSARLLWHNSAHV